MRYEGQLSEGKDVKVGRVRVKADPRAGSTYVYVNEGVIDSTISFGPNVFIDLSEDGLLLGLEVL